MSNKLHTLLLIAILLTGTVDANAQTTTRHSSPSPYSRQQLARRDTTDHRTLYDRYLDNQEKKGRHIERIPREDLRATFIPKGQWMAGGSIAFNEWDGDNLNYLVLKNIDFEGHTFGVSPYFGYFVANNTAFGARFNYSRYYFNLGQFDLNLGEDFNSMQARSCAPTCRWARARCSASSARSISPTAMPRVRTPRAPVPTSKAPWNT